MSDCCNVIVFSKDRAMQLDLLLQSIQRNAPQLWPASILWTCTSLSSAIAYEQLKQEGSNSECLWVKQTADFRKDFLGLFGDKPLSCMLVDDDVFYCPLPNDFGNVQAARLAYAPRLGYNCTYCYNADKVQAPGQLDFDCKLSTDGHIYRTDDLYERMNALPYDTMPDIENNGGHLFRDFTLRYSSHSCLVGIPHNKVRTESECRSMGGDYKELNRRFLAGERLDLDAMDFSDVRGVHQPIEFKFRPAK